MAYNYAKPGENAIGKRDLAFCHPMKFQTLKFAVISDYAEEDVTRYYPVSDWVARKEPDGMVAQTRAAYVKHRGECRKEGSFARVGISDAGLGWRALVGSTNLLSGISISRPVPSAWHRTDGSYNEASNEPCIDDKVAKTGFRPDRDAANEAITRPRLLRALTLSLSLVPTHKTSLFFPAVSWSKFMCLACIFAKVHRESLTGRCGSGATRLRERIRRSARSNYIYMATVLPGRTRLFSRLHNAGSTSTLLPIAYFLFRNIWELFKSGVTSFRLGNKRDAWLRELCTLIM